ncbi:helix-turn-helix transcriptional regulator [Desulfobulbus elongatus]|uniref:helix-turn-helix transcriptional regulator n=1 Tax=Desulfobulbus elongatus TaxID=53332 RepID=UPI0005523FB8|nr:AlpA family phage regulatory protein [Desulfobulbus elongatus]
MKSSDLPSTGFLRVHQIIGDKRRGVPPLLPISKSSWWSGIAKGVYPKPIKISPRCSAWKVSDIQALIARLGEGGGSAEPIQKTTRRTICPKA